MSRQRKANSICASRDLLLASLRRPALTSSAATFGGSPDCCHTDLPRFSPHGTELGVRPEFGDRFRKVLVERVAPLLLNLARLWRPLVAVATVQSGFFHRLLL